MKQLDFDRAFPQTPDCIHAAIEMGFRKGQKQMKMRNKIISLGSIAAALAIFIAVAAIAMGIDRNPKPDVLVQPPVTDIPKLSEESMVWCTEKGNYYHSEEHCSGMEGAIYGTLSYALALDKQPCPVCITSTANALAPTAMAYIADPNTGEVLAAISKPAPTELPLNSDDQHFFEGDPLDYLTEKGIYTHSDSDCCGITGAKPYVYEEARTFNRLSCPVCGSAEEIVYYTTNGQYYHVVEDCSGMKNTRAHHAGEATWDNKPPCPVCVIPYVYEIEMGERERTEEEMKRFYPFEGVDLRLDETVFTELSEKYFHTAEGCSDSPTIEASQLDLAVGRNQLPCPICVLNEEDNYALFKNTFGKEPYEVRKERTGFGFFPQPEKAATCWHFGEFGNVSPTMVFYEIHPDYNAERQLQISFSEDESLDFFGNIEVEPIKDLYGLAIETAEKQLREAGNSTASVWVKGIHVYYDDALQIKACEMSFFFEGSTDAVVRFDVLENGDWDMTTTPNEMWATVYAPYGQARYYHKTSVCNGQQNKRELSLTEAEAENLSPCPDCYGASSAEENTEQAGVVFYRTPNGKYYHLEPDCSGMQNAEACTPEKAIVNTGKHACPVCFDTAEKKALYILSVPWGDADEVYVAVDNDYYHIDPDCFNMVMVSKMDLKSAKDFGKTVCPVCMKEYSDFTSGEQETCWATRNGKYYHNDMYCSGMEHAVSGPVAEAQAMGKLRCPVCIELDLEDYDLFTTAFGQDISDLYYGYNYNHSVGTDWYISNGKESFKLCEVYPNGTAFWGDEPPGVPELYLTGLSADPEQVHLFMKNAPAPIGSMYAAAPAEVEKHADRANLAAEEVQLQRVKVYFDANRQVSSCEMQFGFYDHVKLAWKVGADGQIEMTESELVRPGWDDSPAETKSETQSDAEQSPVLMDTSAASTPSIDANLSFLGTITQIDRLYQSAFGNLEEVLAAGYGFMPEIAENCWILSNGQQTILSLNFQDTGREAARESKWILNVSLNTDREISARFMESIQIFPMKSMYHMAIDAARDHMNEVHTRNSEALSPYVCALRIEFDESFQIQNCRVQFPCAMHALYVGFQREEMNDSGWTWDIKTYTETA